VKRRFLILIAGILLALILIGILTIDTWAPLIAWYLIVNEHRQGFDMIIIPNETDNGDRIRYGATLYKKGFAPKNLLSGSSYLMEETGVDLIKVYAISLGVPERVIWVD
jgi:uncharacterized SAM-binding protein YcdF (DUF218 family)